MEAECVKDVVELQCISCVRKVQVGVVLLQDAINTVYAINKEV